MAAVAAARQLRHAGAGADAARAALVLGVGRRDLPEPQPAQRRAAGPRGGVRRRPHLPDGSAADARPAHRDRRGRDRRRAARAAVAGRPVRRRRGGAGRPHHHRVPREAEGRGRPARRPGPGVRVDGQLHLHDRGADRVRVPGCRGLGLEPRHGRQHRADAGRERRRPRVRLLAQRRPGGERARPRLLARRRDARCVLRRPHGPGLGRPHLQPLQPGVADPELPRAAAAGQVRVRRGRTARGGARLDGVRGGGDLGSDRAPLGAVARRPRALVRDGRGLGADGRRRRRPRRGRAARDPGQERARRAGSADRHRPGGRPRALRRVGGRRRRGRQGRRGATA